jgi:hypothetical protein
MVQIIPNLKCPSIGPRREWFIEIVLPLPGELGGRSPLPPEASHKIIVGIIDQNAPTIDGHILGGVQMKDRLFAPGMDKRTRPNES